MNWNSISDLAQLEEINQISKSRPVLIFKHSTTCPISSMAINKLERSWQSISDEPEAWYLDLLSHRDISQAIASTYDVQHQSPQVLIIVDGKCVYHNSHMSIRYDDLMQAVV